MGNACSTRSWKTKSKIVPLERCREREAPACETIHEDTCAAIRVPGGHRIVTSDRFSAPFVTPRRPQDGCEPSVEECPASTVEEDEEETVPAERRSSNETSVLQDCNRSLTERRKEPPKSARERAARREDRFENALRRKEIARRKTCSECLDYRSAGTSPMDLAMQCASPHHRSYTPTGIATVLEMRRLATEKPMSVY